MVERPELDRTPLIKLNWICRLRDERAGRIVWVNDTPYLHEAVKPTKPLSLLHQLALLLLMTFGLLAWTALVIAFALEIGP